MKNILKKSILCLFTLVTFAQLSAQTTTHYGFDSQADLDNNFTYTCENTNGSMTITSADVKPIGSCLKATMGGTSKKSCFLISKNSFSGISQIEFYLASSDKGKTMFAIEASSDPTFASSVTSILPLTTFSSIQGISNPSNKTLYKVTIAVTNTVSGYLRFTFNQPSSSGKFMWLDELTITTSNTPTPKSSDATLSDLKVNGQTISGFAPTTYDYDYTMPPSQSSWPQITATTNDSKATCDVQQNGNPAVITVTAEDGTQLTYRINYIQTTEPIITSFTVAGVSANINQAQKTITATLPNGTDVSSLTPTVLTDNADSYTPIGAQNFSNPVIYKAIKGSQQTAYTVTLSIAPPKSNDATLSSISVNGTPLPGFQRTTYSYTYELPAGTTDVPNVTATPNKPNTMHIITPASSLPGTTTITVTAEDGTQQVYTIIFKVALPSSDLTCHEPEIYEADTRAGGYGGTLVKNDGREYEVYYIARNSDSQPNVALTPTDKIAGVSTNEGKNSFEAKDGWFKASFDGSSGDTEASAKDEFTSASLRRINMKEGYEFSFRVKGFDQFSFYGKDNSTNTDASKRKCFEVEIDGVKQPITPNNSWTIRRYDLTTDEHVIVIRAISSSSSNLTGFSLRVSDAPRAKYVSGDDKTQVVNQTKQLQPVTYAIRNYVSARLEWTGAEGIGITLTPVNATGDTLQVSGTANCPVGDYTYKVVALDKNGAEASSCTGTFRVQTEVRATNGTEHVVWINDSMTPVAYEYDALNDNDITFSWSNKPDGVEAKQDKGNNQWIISGTPTKEGTYTYTLTAIGGNTITGKLTVDVPDPMFIAPANAVTKVKATQQLVPVVWTVKFAKNVTVTGLPNGITGKYANGTFTLSGTPAAETTYPKTYIYTLSAEPLYEGKNRVTEQGQIIVIDPNAKSLLYLYDDNYNDGVFAYLNKKYDVSPRRTDDRMRAKDQYDMYDVVVISENVDATNEEVLGIIKTLQKPVLNMEVFTYTTSRLGWGYPDNGSGTNTAIQAMQPSHPVFKGMNVKTNDAIEILDQVTGTGIMPTDINLPGSYCLATAIKRGDIYEEDGARCVAIHEVPKSIRGGKYILLPVSQKSQQNLTVQGKRLIDNIISYLVDPTEATIELPELRISSFKIDGIEGKIDETALTIRLTLPAGTNLTALIPEVQIVSNATIVTPSDGETVDFSDQHYGVNYTVSDFINKKVYKVFVNTLTGLEDTAIDSVWFDGNMLHNPAGIWLNIYDIMGRLLTVTNADMDMTTLPTGVYLLQSSNATMKIVRN